MHCARVSASDDDVLMATDSSDGEKRKRKNARAPARGCRHNKLLITTPPAVVCTDTELTRWGGNGLCLLWFLAAALALASDENYCKLNRPTNLENSGNPCEHVVWKIRKSNPRLQCRHVDARLGARWGGVRFGIPEATYHTRPKSRTVERL